MLPRCSFVLRYVFLLVIFTSVILMLLQANTTITKLPDDLRLLSSKSGDPFLRTTKLMTSTISAIRTVNNTTQSKVLINHSYWDNHPFKYLLNPSKLCDLADMYILVYVHTAPGNFKQRMSIRETWGSQQLLGKLHSRLVFLMGSTKSVDTTLAVTMEFNQYGDIVQEDYIDSYRNLTHKANGALKWVTNYCAKAKLILKTDDDIMVNIYHLLKYVHEKLEKGTQPIQNLLLCNKWNRMKVIRDKRSKWYLSKEEFPDEVFPPYCSGSAFLMSADVVRRMAVNSRKMPFFWVDDYYLTGMVFNSLKIPHSIFNKAYILNQHLVLDHFKNDTSHSLVFYHIKRMSVFYSLWKLIQEDHNKPLHKTTTTSNG